MNAFRVCRAILVAVVIAALGDASTWASNESGVRPTVLSLPSGPGSIEGLGESFEPHLNTGTATHAIPLEVPPGRIGFAPELVLSYNGGFGNGAFGLGWRLSVPYLQRQTDRGLPFYTDWPEGDAVDNDRDGQIDEFDEFDVIVHSSGEELVPSADGTYRSENESTFTRFRRIDEGWEAVRRDGTVLRFGTQATTRITGSGGREFRWLLDDATDTRGNQIHYVWTGLDGSRQRYLSSIEYNTDAPGGLGMKIEFVYEARPDVLADFRPRFELKTAYRCSEIRMFAGTTPVRTYRLRYEATGALQPLSLLEAVTLVGSDGTGSLPPTNFGYVSFDGPTATAAPMPEAPFVSLSNGDTDLLDLNADGLPDILDTRYAAGMGHAYYLNHGPDSEGAIGWGPMTLMDGSPPIQLSSSYAGLADLLGEGRSGLLDQFGPAIHYHRIGADLSWEYWGTIDQVDFSLLDPKVRLVDVNNDHRTDVMKADASFYSVWLNLEQGVWSGSFDTAPASSILTFDRESVRLADMNGDRLMDLVRFENGIAEYHPGLGLGEFGGPIAMDNPPFDVPVPARLLLADVNGDGLSDGLYVRNNSVEVWLNLGLDPSNHDHGRFAPSFTVSGPYSSLDTTFRLADINGNGSTDVVWNTVPSGGADHFVFLDFAPGEQPYQLKTIENGIGATTTIGYRSVVQEMNRDGTNGEPWSEGVPIAMQVVSVVEVTDGRQARPYITEYAYHDGFYAAPRKEFRGFEQVEKVSVGDVAEGAPPLVMAHTFDVGREHDALRGKPLAVEAREATGEIYYREDHDWTTRTLAQGEPGDDREVVFAFPRSQTRVITEKDQGTPARLEWEYDYDDFGNRILDVAYGRVEDLDGSGVAGDSLEDRSAWDDERVVTRTFTGSYPSGRANWILGLPVEQETQDEHGVVHARTRHFYDDESFSGLNLGEVSTGNRTLTRRWHDPASPSGYVNSVRNRYDTYGNVTTIYDPLWGIEPGHFREIAYDTVYHTFPVTETIHTGNADAPGDAATLTMTATYDYGFGVMRSSTDPAGFETLYGYDTFGRLASTIKPGDTIGLPTVEYDYALVQPFGSGSTINWIDVRRRESEGQTGTVDSRTFHDGLGREVMTRAEGEVPGQIVVTGAVRFNARQGIFKDYLPYFDLTGGLAFREPPAEAAYTEQHYDALGRGTRIYQPLDEGASSREFSETTYEPLIVQKLDEEQSDPSSVHFGAALRYTYDGLRNENGDGRLRRVDEIVKLNDDGTSSGTPNTWTTRYSYDLLDNYTGYLDAQGNVKTMDYDALGRRFFMNDPDRGYTWYAYDAAGNVRRSRDAEGREIAYDYDGLHRLVGEHYCADHERTGNTLTPGTPWSVPGDSPARTSDVAYHYDYPAGPLELVDGPHRTPPEVLIDVVLERQPEEPAFDLNEDGTIDVADVVLSITRNGPPPASGGSATGETVVGRNTRGYLSWVRDVSGAEHHSFDDRGRIEWVVRRIERSSTDDRRVFKTGYERDSMDRVTRVIYPDQSHVDYTFNSRGLLEHIPNVVTRMDYSPAGQLTTLDYANGASTTLAYDHRLRPKTLDTVRGGDGLGLQRLTYAFDGVSNLTAISDERTEAELDGIGAELGLDPPDARRFRGTQSFRYDSLYRLVRAENDAVYGSLDYRYDRIGNMVHKSATLTEPDAAMTLGRMAYGGSPLDGTNAGAWGRVGRGPTDPPGPHALSATEAGNEGSGFIIVYDNIGNVTRNGGADLAYDHADRLVSYTDASGTAEYAYDHRDRRTSKTVRDAADEIADEVLYIDEHSDVRNGTLLKYVRAGDIRIARSDAEDAPGESVIPSSYYLNDHLQSTSLTLDANAAVVEQVTYHPYGRSRYRIASDDRLALARDYGFTGKEHDDESGLQYFEARYLTGQLGRFITVDPISERNPHALLRNPQLLNSYAYAANNPLVYTDPDGETPLLTGAIGLVVGGIVGGFGAAITGNDVWAGVAGGAVSGALIGSGAALVLGAKAGIMAALGATSAVGAAGSVIGNTTQQIVEYMGPDHSFMDAVVNVDMTEQLIAGGIGALTAATFTGASMAITAARNQGQQMLSQHMTNVSTALYAEVQPGVAASVSSVDAAVSSAQNACMGGMRDLGRTAATQSSAVNFMNDFVVPVVKDVIRDE